MKQSLEILENLISFPTVSADSNIELVDYVANLLGRQGIETHCVFNGDKTKASIYAQVGPNTGGGVLLSGHTDVVPVEGQSWDSDPFTLTQRDGKFFGRGTCDMKGFDALSLDALIRAKDIPLTRPLQIALSYDEEVGLYGAGPLIDDILASNLPKASAVIVGEPTGMDVVNAHNGGFGYDIKLRGYEVHSSIMPQGVSAVMMGARLIEWANQMNEREAARAPSGLAKSFDPHFTTIHVGKITGGTALNITAKECEFIVDFRIVPGDDFQTWIAEFEAEVKRLSDSMTAIRPEAGIDFVRDFYAPGLMPEENGAAQNLVAALTGKPDTRVVSFMTEGGLFQDRGYSAIVCGPGHINQAHQPNEFISQDQYAQGYQFMTKLLEQLV